MGEEEHTGGHSLGPRCWARPQARQDVPLPAHTAVVPDAPDRAAASPPAAGRWAPAAAAAAAGAVPASPQRSACCRGACWRMGAASCGRCFHNSPGTAISAVLQRNNFESYQIQQHYQQRNEKVNARVLGLEKMKKAHIIQSLNHLISKMQL